MSDAVDVLTAGDRIELRFPARGDLIVLARLVTSAISARAGLMRKAVSFMRLSCAAPRRPRVASVSGNVMTR